MEIEIDSHKRVREYDEIEQRLNNYDEHLFEEDLKSNLIELSFNTYLVTYDFISIEILIKIIIEIDAIVNSLNSTHKINISDLYKKSAKRNTKNLNKIFYDC